MLRALKIFIVIGLLGWGGYSLYHHIYFRYLITDLTVSFPIDERWPAPPPPDNFNEIIRQDYIYLGQGAQSYAFESEDGLYVLKIFHFKNYRQPRKKDRLTANFAGYQLGYSLLPEASGIVYMQLSPGTGPSGQVHVYDRMGFLHAIDLPSVRYVIQRKVAPFSGDKKEVALLMDLVEKERALGLYDKDQGLVHNAGFLDGKPVHYDLGKLTYDPDFCRSEEYAGHSAEIKRRLEIYRTCFKS